MSNLTTDVTPAGQEDVGKAPPPSALPSTAKQRWARRGPLLPALIFTIALTQLPFLYTLYISTLDWRGKRADLGRPFVGLDNYKEVFSDSDLRGALFFTIKLTSLVMLVALVLGIAFAVMLDRKFAGRGFIRTLLIGPFLIMPIASALMWKHAFFNPTYGLLGGVTNEVRGWFGDDSPTTFALIGEHPLIALCIPLIWQWTPFMMLIILAGLQSQPQDVLEAARVDGASNRQIFTSITLPHLRQYLELSLLLGSIYVLQAIEVIVTLTEGRTGTRNLPFEVYQKVIEDQEYGLGSAAGVVVVIGTFIVATLALRTASTLFKMEEGQ